jgi:hypothetical protein
MTVQFVSSGVTSTGVGESGGNTLEVLSGGIAYSTRAFRSAPIDLQNLKKSKALLDEIR